MWSLLSRPRALLSRSKQSARTARIRLEQQRNQRLKPLDPALWGLAVTDSGRLQLDGVDLASLAERWGSPLHVVHAAALDRNRRAFAERPAGGLESDLFYSYKTNPIPGVLRRLHDNNVGAEVISAYELWLALRLGVPPQRIIYNGPVKSDASLRTAIEQGVLVINANHREELERIEAIAKELGKRPVVGLRVSTTHSWTGQFGVRIKTGEALDAVTVACRSPHLDFRAFHVHFGTPLRSSDQLAGFLGEALDFIEKARSKLGFRFELLDVGGSLASATVTGLSDTERSLSNRFFRGLRAPDPQQTISITEYVRTVHKIVAAHSATHGQKPPRLLFEPGRAMTSNTQFLLASVHELKASKGLPPYAILDAGINLAPQVPFEYHQLFPVTNFHQPRTRSYRLTGPICSPGDVLYQAVCLPELSRGSQLLIADAGAYFVPFATSFSFPQPAVVMLEDGQARLLRRAETFEDQIALDVMG